MVVTGNTVFRLLQNEFFIEYQKKLASGRKISLPSRDGIINTTLPLLHSKLVGRKEAEAMEVNGVTISLDGWTDISHCSVYAVLVLVKKKLFILLFL